GEAKAASGGGEQSQQSTEPDEGHQEREKKIAVMKSISGAMDDVDLTSDDAHGAFGRWLCDRYGVDQSMALRLDRLEHVKRAICSRSADGGHRSPRRLFLDRRLDLAPGADWQATGYDDNHDWQKVNGRYRVLVDEAVDGDDTKRDFHESLKARHEVPSFKDLTCAEVMDEIHELEKREPSDPNGHMPERLDYILAQIDENVPQSEEIDLEDDTPSGRWERETAPDWAQKNARRGMGRNYQPGPGGGRYWDIAALRDHDGPAGDLVRAVYPSAGTPTVTDLLRLVVKAAEAETLEDIDDDQLERWASAAEGSEDVLLWVDQCLEAEGFVDAYTLDVDDLVGHDDDLDRLVKLARQAVDDGRVRALLETIREREGVSTYLALCQADLADWLEWLDQGVKPREYAIKQLVDDDREAHDGPEPIVDWEEGDLEGFHAELFELVDTFVGADVRDRYLAGPAGEGMSAKTFPQLPDEHVEKLFRRLMDKGDAAQYIREKVGGAQ
ncbi:MAG: hypothetical protein ABEN55_09900, partial [Bradymonadaceae bacterium]